MSAKIVGKYRGRDWLTIQEWTQEELQTLIDAAMKIKKLQKERKPHDYLLRQTLFMIFFNRSLRTRNSFEAGMTQMGGHAHFLSPQDVYRPALPDDEEALDRFNEKVLEQVNDSGELFLSHTRLHGKFTLRLAIGNLKTRPHHLDRAKEALTSAVTSLVT